MSTLKSFPVVFTAQSKVFFYCRDAVCEFVFKRNKIPLNPFRMFDYFLGNRVDRERVRQANNNLIRTADELWVFGETIANGVLEEIHLAKKLNKPIKFFTIDNQVDKIKAIQPKHLHFEQEVYKLTKQQRTDLIAGISGSHQS